MIWPMPTRPSPYKRGYKTEKMIFPMRMDIRRHRKIKRHRGDDGREDVKYSAPPDWRLSSRIAAQLRAWSPRQGNYRKRFSW